VSRDLDDQDRVLSEVSHDLANCFHRSYYLLDLLHEVIPAGDDTVASTVGRLRGTLEEIEAMSRSALAFVRPIELRRLRVRMDDLVASMRQHVGIRRIEISGDSGAGRCEVDVDPARISEALSLLCKASMHDGAGGQPLVVELLDGNPVALRIHRDAGLDDPARRDLPMALTARIAHLHGGDLDIQDGEASSLTLKLPLAAGEAGR
jgi:signal transduction histidine kinase